MNRSLAAVALAGLFVATQQVSARDDDDYEWRRGRYGNSRNDDWYGNSGSRNDGWYGQRAGMGIIDRTMSDLQRAASRNRVNSHERDHFRRAMSELQNFRYRTAGGRFDEGRLNRVIEDLEHLANARQIHPSDRQILARDMYALRDLRSSRGGYYRR